MKLTENGHRKLASQRLWIPIPLLIDAIRKGYLYPLKLFCLLKAYSSGALHLSKDDFEWLGRVLKKSDRTIKGYLKLLLKWNWVGYDPKTETYFVRATREVFKASHNKWVGASFEIHKDLQNFQDFAFGAIAAYHERKYNIRKKKSELGISYAPKLDALLKKGGAHRSGLGLGAPMACYYLALMLDSSKPTISRKTRSAIGAGYLKRVRKDSEDLRVEFTEVDKVTYMVAKKRDFTTFGYVPCRKNGRYYLRTPKPNVYTSMVSLKKLKR